MNKIFLSAIFSFVTLAMMSAAETQKQPAAGTSAPDFKLTTGDGSQVSLKDYRGKWVVLYFYPKDFTSGCTMEAKNFHEDFRAVRLDHGISGREDGGAEYISD